MFKMNANPLGASEWRCGPDLRRARAALGLGVLGARLYAVGGFDGKEFLGCAEVLSEPDGEWTTLWPSQPVAATVSLTVDGELVSYPLLDLKPLVSIGKTGCHRSLNLRQQNEFC